MTTLSGFFLALLFVPDALRMADEDQALEALMARSDLVVAGEILSQPQGASTSFPVVNYVIKFKVLHVLKGQIDQSKPLSLCIVRNEIEKDDDLPFLRKGAKCILFLRSHARSTPQWKTCDPWFGVLPHNSVLINYLKRKKESG